MSLLLGILLFGLVLGLYIWLIYRVDRYAGRRRAAALAEPAAEPTFLDRHFGSLLGYGLLVLASAQRSFGFLLGICIIFAVPLLLIEALLSIRQVEKRSGLKMDAAFLLGAIALVLPVHGHFPQSDAEVKQIQAEPDIDGKLAYYWPDRDGRPVLCFAASMIYWTRYEYDFDHQQWYFRKLM